MKKSQSIVEVVFSVFLIFLVVFAFCSSTDVVIDNVNLSISVISLILIVANDRIQIFGTLYLRIVFIVTVFMQTLTNVLLMFIDFELLSKANIILSLVIVFELSVNSIVILVKKQVSAHVKVFSFKVRSASKKIKEGKNIPHNISNSFSFINSWIGDNSRNNNAEDLKEIISSLNFFSEAVLCTNIKLVDEIDDKIIDSFIETLLKVSQSINRNNLSLFRSFLETIISIIKLQSKNGNIMILGKYLELYCHKLFETELAKGKDNETRQLLMINLFFDEEVLLSIDYSSDVIIKISSICTEFIIEFEKYEFNVNERVLLIFNQEYLRFFLLTIKKGTRELDFNTLRYIIKKTYQISISINSDIFFISCLSRILDSEFRNVKIVQEILNSLSSSQIDEKYLVFLYGFIEEKIKKEQISIDASYSKYIRIVILLLARLEFKTKNVVDLNLVFDYFNVIKDPDIRKDFIEDDLSLLLIDKENILYFHKSLIDMISEINFENIIEKYSLIQPYVKYYKIDKNHEPFVFFIKKLIDVNLKTNALNNKKCDELLKKILEIENNGSRNINNNQYNELSVRIFSDYLENKAVHRVFYDKIFTIGVENIESRNSSVVRAVSHTLGWCLFSTIDESCTKQKCSENISDLKYQLRKCLSLFQLSCVYCSEEDSIFIGTLFVVNLTSIQEKIEDSKVPEVKRAYLGLLQDYTDRVKVIEAYQKEILKKSFGIRSLLITSYIKGKDEDKIMEMCKKVQDNLKL